MAESDLIRPPVVLDTDSSVGPLPGEIRLTLSEDWRGALRFGCRRHTLFEGMTQLTPAMPEPGAHGPVFLGSGDFHHLSWPLILRCLSKQEQPVDVVVLDNHPDNMRFPWGIHCGSWVHEVAKLTQVAQVHVIGITSGDIGFGHVWEHHLGALYARKVTYWSSGVNVKWASRLGLASCFRRFPDLDTLVLAASEHLAQSPRQVYVSIDKDVFDPEVLRTNWDQGKMQEPHLRSLLKAVRGRIIGSDVTGDVSTWQYRSAWKRWLSTADGQSTERQQADLPRWQARQHEFNLQLTRWLHELR